MLKGFHFLLCVFMNSTLSYKRTNSCSSFFGPTLQGIGTGTVNVNDLDKVTNKDLAFQRAVSDASVCLQLLTTN